MAFTDLDDVNRKISKKFLKLIVKGMAS